MTRRTPTAFALVLLVAVIAYPALAVWALWGIDLNASAIFADPAQQEAEK